MPPVEELPPGERRNPCFCPLGRALRKDMGEAFFLAVGTKHLRLASTDGNVKEIARRIRNSWNVGEDKLSSPVGEQFLTISLPAEMREFVAEFNAGKLPALEGRIEESEKVRFNELANRLWRVTVDSLRRVRRLNPSRKPRL